MGDRGDNRAHAPDRGRSLLDPPAGVLDALPWGIILVDGRGRVEAANASARRILGDDPWIAGRAGASAPGFLLDGLTGEEPREGDAPDSSTGEHRIRWWSRPLQSGSHVRRLILLDPHPLPLARERQQASVAALGLHALRGSNLQGLFEAAVEELRRLLDVEFTKVLQLDPDGSHLTLRAGRGWGTHVVPGESRVSAGMESQAGYTLQNNGPVVVADLRTEGRFKGPLLLVEHGVVSGMSVIIHGRAGPWGVLGVHTTRSRVFNVDDVNFLQSVANVLAGAIQRREVEEDLEERVQERTARLERALADLETFTNGASHDLRAPLRGVEAILEAAAEDLEAGRVDAARGLVDRARRENRKAQHLVRDLLFFARSGKESLHLEDVDVTALADSVVEDLIQTHPTWNVEWRIARGLHAWADRGLLRILLHNLLDNAAKYSQRQVSPRVTLDGAPDARGMVFRVQDNGVGFPPEEAYRLFGPFHRLSTAMGFEGTGLGLATVHRIAARHGGEVWATSAPGKGSTFYFRLMPRP